MSKARLHKLTAKLVKPTKKFFRAKNVDNGGNVAFALGQPMFPIRKIKSQVLEVMKVQETMKILIVLTQEVSSIQLRII